MIGGTIRRFECCESTNDEAAKWAKQIHDRAPHGGVIVADSQSAGRGRLGRLWHSPPASNLYFSVVLRLALPPQKVPPITLCAGLAVCEVVNTRGIVASIKWPNDIYVGKNKLAGVLTEMTTQSQPQSKGQNNPVQNTVIVGIGVNVNATAFPPELAATSLAMECGQPVDRGILLGDILASMHQWVERYCARGVSALQQAFEGHSMLSGQLVRAKIAGQIRSGKVVSLSDDGALLMRDSDGVEHKIIAGEVECMGDPNDE